MRQRVGGGWALNTCHTRPGPHLSGGRVERVSGIPLSLPETIDPVPGAPAYRGAIIHANYTHSLVGALIIALLAGLVAARFWGQRGGLVIGGVVFSHWIPDLLVHRPDLPILPGNLGTLPLLGFGLWIVPPVSAALEAILIAAGGILYYRAATTLPTNAVVSSQRGQVAQRAVVAASVTGLLLVLALACSLMDIA